MTKSSLLILALFVLGALAGAFLMWAGSDTHNVTPSALEARLEDDSDVEPIDAIVAGDDPESTDLESTDDEPPEGLLAMAREELPAAASVRLLVVQVWDRKKGIPAGEADVFVLDGFDGPELEDPYAQHWSDLAEYRGRRFKTDVQGRVELPPVQDWAIVTAQLAGAYGFAKVGRRHRDVETITLHSDETVTVRVTDGEGQTAAGVPVGVVQRVPMLQDAAKLRTQLEEIDGQRKRVEAYIRDNPAQRQAAMGRVRGLRERQAKVISALQEIEFGKKKAVKGARRKEYRPKVTTRVYVRARRRTDADGIAVFRHFQVYRYGPRKWWPSEHIDQFEALLLMPLQQPPSRAFAGRPVPTERLELRLPPTGSISLRTVDRDGRPFTHPVHADLRVVDGESAPWTWLQIRKEQDEAAIVFPFVGLGLRFTAHCRLDDEDFRWSLPLFAGPNHPGEQLTVDLVVAPTEGMLFGRLLDGAGTPLAGVRPTFLINTHSGRLEGEEITVDKTGRFHLPYQVREQHRAPFRLEIRRNDVRPTAGLAMALPMLPPARVTDLGDLRIDGFGQITGGTVVDDRGLPIAGATVQLQRQREVGGKQPRLEFADEAFAESRTDTEGHYELFGELESGRYRLRAQAKDHFPLESPDLRRGEPLDLRLERKARVVGTVLTPSWLPSRSVRVRLESAVDPKQRRNDQVHDNPGAKYIYFDWVRAGIYNLSLRVQDFPDPFLRIDGLEIAPGQTGLHPRLRDLDLSAYLFRFEAIAIDEGGQPIQPKGPLLARITRPDGRSGFIGFPWKKGQAEVFSTSPQLEVWPLSSGYHAEPTVLGPGRTQLRFLKIPPVDLHAPGLGQLAGTAPVWISVRPTGNTGLPNKLETWDRRSGRISGWYAKSRTAGARLREDDSVRLTLMQGGRYQVVAYLGRKADGVSPVPVDLGAVDVRLAPGAGPQRVTANVDPELVQAGLAKFAQRVATSGAGK